MEIKILFKIIATFLTFSAVGCNAFDSDDHQNEEINSKSSSVSNKNNASLEAIPSVASDDCIFIPYVPVIENKTRIKQTTSSESDSLFIATYVFNDSVNLSYTSIGCNHLNREVTLQFKRNIDLTNALQQATLAEVWSVFISSSHKYIDLKMSHSLVDTVIGNCYFTSAMSFGSNNVEWSAASTCN